jgi:tRNA-dihydrouridine synthase
MSEIKQVYSDHQRLAARSLAMHCLVARKLLANPALLAQVRDTLARWRTQAAEPVPAYFLEWGRVLEWTPEEIAAFLASMREDATRLRQSSPFTSLLTSEERARIFEAFRLTKDALIEQAMIDREQRG